MESVLNLHNGQVKFLGGIQITKNRDQFCSSKPFFGLVKMTLELVHAGYRLSKWQAVKLTLFALWTGHISVFSFSYLYLSMFIAI